MDSIISSKDRSNTLILAQKLKAQIKNKKLSIQLLKQQYNLENTRASVTFKNVENITISFYKIDQKMAIGFGYNKVNNDSLVNSIIKKNNPFKTIQNQLADKKDYFEYSTELLLPPIELGNYLVYFESETGSKEQKAYAYETISVSNLSLLAWQNEKVQYYQVLDRKTGMPLEKATLKSPSFSLLTNERGIAKYQRKEINNYNREQIDLVFINDTLQINKNYITNINNYSSKKENSNKARVEFYLDRAIYRPGQTVYYKGIAFEKKQETSSIVSHTTFKIKFDDANYKSLKEFDVVTNEFGSFSGEFVLPKTGLTGNFSIEAQEPDDYEKDIAYDKTRDEHPFWDHVDFDNSRINFKVEEYKRPKFEVTFEPTKESYQVNQNIQVKGSAKAFTGSNITEAKVNYTVTRFTNNYARRYQQEESEVIKADETTTDSSGNFTIAFVAKPSPNSTKEQLPVFNYRISASVTDNNGETHDNQTAIKLGYHTLQLKANITPLIETKDKNIITLTTTTLNGQFVPTKGLLKLYFVKNVSNKFKSRTWPIPEIVTIQDDQFEQLFPYEQNEKSIQKDELGTLVYTKTINSEKDKTIPLDFISIYQSGDYKIVFTAKDNFNNLIEDSTDFQLIQSNDVLKTNELLTIKQINTDPKKDGFVLIKIDSSIPTLFISTTANYQNTLFYEDYVSLQNKQALIKIPIQKQFKNNIKIGFQIIFENQPFSKEIQIPLKEKDETKFLIETATFRNKLEPGTLENWSFKLKTEKPNTEAEILASMYDRSLDSFAQSNWNSLHFYESNYNYINYKSTLGFDKTYTDLRNLNPIQKPIALANEQSKLMWFGFDFNESIIRINHNSFTTSEINDKKIGNENIKGDPDAVLSVSPNADQLTFIKPVYAKAEESLQEVVLVGYGTTKQKGLVGAVAGITIRGKALINENNEPLYIVDGEPMLAKDAQLLIPNDILSIEVLKDTQAKAIYGTKGDNGVIIITTKKALEALTQVKARKNLSETAFFYPHLKTDHKGNMSFNFNSPEALTAWKLRLLAHNKNAVSGYLEKIVITQKDIMVTPNFPRFFREKDSITITTKIANLTKEPKTGIAVLQLFDATTMKSIDVKMLNEKNVKNYTVSAYGNTTVSWNIYVPGGLQGVQYKVLAKSGNYSDGEENILPVLTNSILVTESMPIWFRENSKKEYTFENLKNNNSTTLRNHQFTLEYTSNPTWIALQSLPYLMDSEHESSEQTFARFYANALATTIITSNPQIAAVFESWKKDGKPHSKLEENEELKSLILAETPWIKDAQSEEEKKKNLALLFDLEKMKSSQDATFEKLKKKQTASGGFTWFGGNEPNEYISRHILAGLGHLLKLSPTEDNKAKITQIAATAIPFLDEQFLSNHRIRTQNLKKTDKLIWVNPNSDLHYLYTRSFYLESNPVTDTLKKATSLYIENIKTNWLTYSLYEKGLAALTLNRFEEKAAAKKIIESLKETASNNEDWGMYWIENKAGWYWYQAPIETQALLIEAFAEVTNDNKSVDAMKVWLLKNKQIKNWPTTKSTTEAVYALLMQGSDWLSVKDNTVIKIGDEKILTKKLAENQKEAETGYLKLNWKADEIKKEMATISINNKSNVPGYGGVYWQYFEDLDKIKNDNNNSLSITKELYLKKNNAAEAVLTKINEELTIGDLVTVRLIISTKEDMEFVHLKDMRASCFEPVDVLSGYQYKDNLGFYKSTKDAATHFFFDKINKGTYVLEYDVRVNNKGNFSNGITTIQSMYAPEFTSHSNGIQVKVEN
ncbi:MG2 domain-containing protein [Flavobacterium sp. Arc3]|uniref:alpha-2-macroglobulin family protein n=1 Tax=Flavobacterium sp. Arc3 TaxID=3046686 RepID=UPI00352E98E4